MIKTEKDQAIYSLIRTAISEEPDRLSLVIAAITDGLNDEISRLTKELSRTQLALSVSLARTNSKAQTKELVNSLLEGTQLDSIFK